jgi:protein-tyrosine phosphatase
LLTSVAFGRFLLGPPALDRWELKLQTAAFRKHPLSVQNPKSLHSRSIQEISVLMVCMGNICRSPTAEGVLRAKVAQAGLTRQVHIESAGTHNYHPGNPPDERSQAHALRRGYDLSPLRARQLTQDDYADFDLILAMDWDNLALLQLDCPPQHAIKLKLLMEFAGAGAGQTGKHGAVVPDPYHGGDADFERVLDLTEAACEGLTDILAHTLRHV